MSKQPTATPLPDGTIFVPSLMCGVAGGLVGLLLSKLNLLEPLNSWFLTFSEQGKFSTEEFTVVAPPIEWAIGFVLAIAVSILIMDSAFIGRRLFLAAGSLVLFAGALFSLLLWGTLLMPWMIACSLVVGIIFTLIYASLHTMPCEVDYNDKAPSSEAIKNNGSTPVAEVKAEETKKKSAKESVPLPNIGKAQKSEDKVVVKTPKVKK